MVLLLSGVGLATGVFFFVGRDLYSTIILHNALALRGVTQALADAGRLEFYERPQLPRIAAAVAAVAVLVLADVLVVRPSAPAPMR